jgi:hypothetical protein
MYNRYIPGEHGHVRVKTAEPVQNPPAPDENQYTPTSRETQAADGPCAVPRESPCAQNTGDKFGGLGRLLGLLKLEKVDQGDLLLFLILLLLLTDGDELDMVITLGLLLLLGMGDQKNPDSGLSGFLKSL